MLGKRWLIERASVELLRRCFHKVGDVVTVATPKLGRLRNTMRLSPDCSPWTFGAANLMRHLARHGVL